MVYIVSGHGIKMPPARSQCCPSYAVGLAGSKGGSVRLAREHCHGMTCNRWHPGGATAGSGSGQLLVKLGSVTILSGFFILKQRPKMSGLRPTRQLPGSLVVGLSEMMGGMSETMAS